MSRIILSLLGVFVSLLLLNAADDVKTSQTEEMKKALMQFVPESNEYALLFSMDCFSGNDASGKKYWENNVEAFQNAKVERIGYYLRLERQDGNIEQAWVSMDPFQEKIADCSLPRFWPLFTPIRKEVKNLTVKSNVPGVKNGNFVKGNVEIWLGAVSPINSAGIAGASDTAHDIGDSPEPGHYGVFQIHNTQEKQTIIAFNHWYPAKNTETDVGVGNAPEGEPDWTFSNSGKNCKSACLLILVKVK
ncbi:MAG: hypothetical protein WC637_03810 [Victivallales bacterium]